MSAYATHKEKAAIRLVVKRIRYTDPAVSVVTTLSPGDVAFQWWVDVLTPFNAGPGNVVDENVNSNELTLYTPTVNLFPSGQVDLAYADRPQTSTQPPAPLKTAIAPTSVTAEYSFTDDAPTQGDALLFLEIIKAF